MMPQCHACGSSQEVRKCSNCSSPTCEDCLRARFVCPPCGVGNERSSDLGNVAEAMIQGIRRFKACLSAETNYVAVIETAPDVAEAHALVLEMEIALPARVHWLQSSNGLAHA